MERLLGITDDIPARASVIRVMLMELPTASPRTRRWPPAAWSSAMTPMFFGFGNELILTVFEAITGLRMNNATSAPAALAAGPA